MKATIGAGASGGVRLSARPMNWGVCAGVTFLGSVLLWADRSNFSVAAAAWAKQYGWQPAIIGMMLSAFSLGYLLMQPIGGWIADRIGPRRTVAITMAGWSLWVLLTPIAPAVLWLTASFRVLLGLSEAPYIPASAAAVAKAIPSEARRGKFAAFMQSGAQLGPATGVFFAGIILSATASPAMIFIIFGGIGLAGAALWWAYARRFSDPVPTGAQADTAEAKARAAQAPVSNLKLITSPALWPFYIGYFALPYCQYIFLAWLPQYLSHYRHIPLVQASLLSALPYLTAFVAVNFAGWGMDWFAKHGWRKGAFHRKIFIGLGALIYATTTLIAANTELEHGRGHHDRHRQCRAVVLCHSLLDDLHRHRAATDGNAERADEFLRHLRRDALALSERRHRRGDGRVRGAAGARCRHHAGRVGDDDPAVPRAPAGRAGGRPTAFLRAASGNARKRLSRSATS